MIWNGLELIFNFNPNLKSYPTRKETTYIKIRSEKKINKTIKHFQYFTYIFQL